MATRPRVTPRFVAPMECTPVEVLPDDGEKWLYEVKLDGYRCCAVVHGGRATLYSRYGNAWPGRFPHIQTALAALEGSMVLDGEIVALDRRGLPSFQELQNWQSTRAPIVFYLFDVTQHDGRDLRRVPIEARKEILAALPLRDPLRLAEALDAKLTRIVSQMKKLGLEGIVAKRRGSLYASGQRSRAWLKHRFNEVDDFPIGGYLPEDDTFSRLLIGTWQNGRFLFVKKLKNGFSRVTKQQVMEALRGLEIDACPFANLPEPKGRRSAVDAEVMKTAVWVEPRVKVEVEFVEWTSGGRLRHASFRKVAD